VCFCCSRLMGSCMPMANHHATYRILMISPSFLRSRLPPANIHRHAEPQIYHTVPSIAPTSIILSVLDRCSDRLAVPSVALVLHIDAGSCQ
jgi:hypothetical protein